MSIERCDREIAQLKALAMSGHPDVAGICGGIRDWAEERRLIMDELASGLMNRGQGQPRGGAPIVTPALPDRSGKK